MTVSIIYLMRQTVFTEVIRHVIVAQTYRLLLGDNTGTDRSLVEGLDRTAAPANYLLGTSISCARGAI
jgi:hypothetical protein